MTGEQLLAGGAGTPLADREDEAGFLEQRDELGRGHQPEIRMLPAQQCLDTENGAARGIDLRLVIQAGFIAPHGMPHAGFQRHGAARPSLPGPTSASSTPTPSPPKRATVSPSRTLAVRRSASACNNLSPTSW